MKSLSLQGNFTLLDMRAWFEIHQPKHAIVVSKEQMSRYKEIASPSPEEMYGEEETKRLENVFPNIRNLFFRGIPLVVKEKI